MPTSEFIPQMKPLFGEEERKKLKDAEFIEFFALAYMRGINIDN